MDFDFHHREHGAHRGKSVFPVTMLRVVTLDGRSASELAQSAVIGIPTQSVGTRNALINLLTKFDEFVNVRSGRCWCVHNPKFLPEGGFSQGQNRPKFCLNSR